MVKAELKVSGHVGGKELIIKSDSTGWVTLTIGSESIKVKGDETATAIRIAGSVGL